MALLENTFEAGSHNTALTQGSGGNTGGDSGNYLDIVNKGADGVLRFSNTQAKGMLSAQIATRAVAAVSYLGWTTSYADITTDYGRTYLYMEDWPAATHWFAQFMSAAAVNQGGIQIQNNGKLRLFDAIAGGANFTDSVAVLAADTWYRLEWKFTVGVSLVVRIYAGDSSTLIEEITRPQTGSAALSELRLGVLIGLANYPSASGHYYIDNVVSGDSDWTGPAPQIGRPIADVSIGNWTTDTGGTSNLYASIDEITLNTLDYVQSGASPGVADVLKVRLSPIVDPAVNTGHEIRYSYRKSATSGDQIDLTVKLYAADGTTLIHTETHTDIPATETPGTFTLSGAEADAIPGADYATGLVLAFEAIKP